MSSRWRWSVCAVVMGWLAVGVASKVRAQTATASVPTTGRASEVLSRLVTVDVNRVSLESAVHTIAASANVRIIYRGPILAAVTTPVTLHVVQLPIGEALERVLARTKLQVIPVTSDAIAIQPMSLAEAHASGTITGTVRDAETKQPLKGATVMLDESTRGVTTSDDGAFRIADVTAGSHRITVRLLGYTRQIQTVVVADGEVATVTVMLSASTNTLDQVVVTGTVVQTELKAVPNAITVITAKQIEERGITKLDQLFRGDVPGLFAQNQGAGALLDEVTMFSRGATALSSASAGTSFAAHYTTNPIKTYIDGVELADPKYLNQIDPRSIERIEILAGPQASTIYGSNAINGVMQIFTKRGTTSIPQLTLSLLSGFVQNNFSNALTPQHDYSAQLNGVEGRLSYNAGGSWNYLGPWTPAKQTARTEGFGGVRLDLPTLMGKVTADMTLRRSITQNRQRGSQLQTETGYRETGWYSLSIPNGLSVPNTFVLMGQTLGLTLGYVPTSWWSHELGLGQDASDTELRYTTRGYLDATDTTLLLQQNHTDRRSIRYTTTAQVPMTSLARVTITIGADAWQKLTSAITVFPQTLTGSLTGSTKVSRLLDHNAGSFLQTQIEVRDQLFLTYGLRAEWNPGFGEEVQPSYAPRYGIAYTRQVGPVTAKLRGSYGRSTRPPQSGLKVLQTITDRGLASYVPFWGNFAAQLANPELAPEHQQGGEGGLELYAGTRGSLIVTRYNQIVDGLIAGLQIDSVDMLPDARLQFGVGAWEPGYYQYQSEYLNIGSIRNQGWELQGSLNVGPLATHGTYSWTKSRTIGVDPKYKTFFNASSYPQYQPGATFQYLPEHTWALGMTYARSQTTMSLNLTGTGRIANSHDYFFSQSLVSDIRLSQNRFNMNFGKGYINFNSGYTLADLTAAHRASSKLELVVQVQNLTDHYTNDNNAQYATMGRQVKGGLRVRLQ